MTTYPNTGPVVIVDPYSSGALFHDAFARYDIGTVAVLSDAEPPAAFASSYRPEDFDTRLHFDGDLERLVDAVRSLGPRAVITGCESGVELAEQLAPRVHPDRCNVVELAPARRDKWEMARAVRRAGLATIPQICTDDANAVARWLAEEALDGRDLVIKPPKSASTDGVVKVAAGQDWREVFDRQLGRTNQFGETDDALLVQQFMTGTEYVIDLYSDDGDHRVVDVCRYRKVDNGEHMAIYDEMQWVAHNDPAIPALTAYAKAVLDAVGMRFGSTHVEVIATDAGPILIELGARPHGGGHPRFNMNAIGDSQIERTVRNIVTGTLDPDYELLQHQSCVFHIAPATGRVHNVAALDVIADLESRHFSVHHLTEGGPIVTTQTLVDSLEFGFAILSHPDAEQIRRDYRTIRSAEAALLIDSLAAAS